MRFITAFAVIVPLASALSTQSDVSSSSISEAEKRSYSVYCGVNGFQKHEPFKIIKTTCDPTKCAAICDKNAKCKSYSVGKDQCRLYSSHAAPGFLTPNRSSPFKHFDKSCKKASSPKPKTTSTKRSTTTCTTTKSTLRTTTKSSTSSSSKISTTESSTTSVSTTVSSTSSSASSTTTSSTPTSTSTTTSATTTAPTSSSTTSTTTTAILPAPTCSPDCSAFRGVNPNGCHCARATDGEIFCSPVAPEEDNLPNGQNYAFCGTGDSCSPGLKCIAALGLQLVKLCVPPCEPVATTTTTTTTSSTTNPAMTTISSTTSSTTSSSTTSTSTTSTGPAAAPSSCKALPDPYTNSATNLQFDLQCEFGALGSIFNNAPADTYQACVDRCAMSRATTGCIGIVWTPENGLCAQLGSSDEPIAFPQQDLAYVINAPPPTSLTCDAFYSTQKYQYTTGGRTFTLTCNLVATGQTLSTGQANSYQECMDSCGGMPACVAVNWAGQSSTCTLLSSFAGLTSDGTMDSARV